MNMGGMKQADKWTSCQKDTTWRRDKLVIEMIPSALLISKSDETTHHQPVVAHICGDFLDQADPGRFLTLYPRR